VPEVRVFRAEWPGARMARRMARTMADGLLLMEARRISGEQSANKEGGVCFRMLARVPGSAESTFHLKPCSVLLPKS
jgi:hypothetical protein